MKISELATRVKANCPIFEGRVGGTFDLDKVKNNTDSIDTPWCFCLHIGEDAGPPEQDKDKNHFVRETFSIVVCVDHRRHKHLSQEAFAADDELTDIRQQLFDALLNWSPIGGTRSIAYQSGRVILSEQHRLWYAFVFWCDYYVNTETPYDEITLTDIYLDRDLTGKPNNAPATVDDILANTTIVDPAVLQQAKDDADFHFEPEGLTIKSDEEISDIAGLEDRPATSNEGFHHGTEHL